MDAGVVATVRRFSRTVTQRFGALNEHYLGGARPLGEARLLWEIGDGRDLRTLRATLGLDSGYLSRLLRSLEADGLVTVQADAADRRVRVARLTTAGKRERRALDRRSDGVAEAVLAPLSPRQRERLVAAMAEVSQLLRVGMVEVEAVDPGHPDVLPCFQAYFADLAVLFEDGFSPDAVLQPAIEVVLLARLGEATVGCVALYEPEPGVWELKRMWVDSSARGLGLGRRLLAEAEALARQRGASAMRLDTNRSLTGAIALYRSAGFEEVPPFNAEPHAHHWFHKAL
ncbi:bifunctional helix-turn-helix transcriptional regulator/GNAT family N-acetyltransferase [Kutzneria sp. 744]|uniref:bifunctional helix-turn-helix transcriptional regulator/GNAT family N-acetyltransferase n=1 Tax=Kutzneria sp. (strain 744) TaxID=345341 RepID=UPI0003EECA54|nr:bifunctional helix-turn-helix transcriptional regulator/GNAT family N-acetyltransferase [Kutzneria sp. 744]EWM12291.1 transcriptional regulator PadR [Kutzneria sp. 744]